MSTIFDVARYIVTKEGSITTMKLQKLCYYAQSWSLAWDNEPLFEEDFEAWANGPVSSELFSKHRGVYRVDESFLEDEIDEIDLNSDQIETIESILDFYGDKSPRWLSELTHKERPWRETRGSLPLGSYSNKVISKDLMLEYYGGLLDG